MALEGSLKEFGLADILQLIYYQRKTGVLSLESRLDKVRLLLSDGRITSAESKRRSEEGRLGKILLKKGLITEDELNDIIKEQKSTSAKFGHILLKRGLVGKEQIQEILQSQITEIITQLFAWKDGRYEFRPQGVPVDKEIPVLLDTQHLLMEGLRIIDEWTLIEGKISLNSLFERTDKPSLELTDEESELLRFVDGESDVSTIANVSGRDSFQVSKTLLSLLEKGAITQKQAPVAVKEEAIVVKPLPYIRFLPLISVILGIIISLFFLPMIKVDMKALKASEEIDRLRFQLNVYMQEMGLYPAGLKEITTENDPWGEPYIYTSAGENFVLLSAGPDKKIGTEDDIY